MTTIFDRKIFFDKVRGPLFGGQLTQQQVDGMNFKLEQWEEGYAHDDIRWLAYCLATSKHETASKMWPIEEYGKGAGHPYGEINSVTGVAYYGRGDVQLTHDYNYQNATQRLGLSGDDDLYWHPDKALDPQISADIMFTGMEQGWFRSPNKLGNYFNDNKEDAFNARDIINGDKHVVPSWSHGSSIGNLVKDYYNKFLSALKDSLKKVPKPKPDPEFVQIRVVTIVTIGTDGSTTAEVTECVQL